MSQSILNGARQNSEGFFRHIKATILKILTEAVNSKSKAF